MASPRQAHGRGGSRPVQTKGGSASTRAPKPGMKLDRRALSSSPAGSDQPQRDLLEIIAQSVNSGRAPEEMAKAFLRLLLELTGARHAAVYLQDEQTKEMQCVATGGRVNDRVSLQWVVLVAQMVQEGHTLSSGDLLACPLKRGKRVEGALVLEGVPPEKRGQAAVVELLECAAPRLAMGLDHARLARKYVQKIVRIQHLEEVSRILNSSLDARAILQQAVEAALRLVEAEAGLLSLADERTGALHVAVEVGLSGLCGPPPSVRPPDCYTAEVARTGAPVMVREAERDPRIDRAVDRARGVPTRSLLAVPVRSRDRTLGVLEAVNKKDGRPFSNWDLTEFACLANQVAIALDNSRLFKSHQEQIARLTKLQEISAVLNSSLNQAEIRKRAIEGATVLMDAEVGSLLLWDEAAQELYFDIALGPKGEVVKQIRLKVGQGIAGYVAMTGEPVIVNDCWSDPRFNREADIKSGFRTRNMVCVPVKARDKLLGVLQAINKRDGGLFGEEDLQDFVSLGHQVGIAIENANLYQEINHLFEGFISASVLAIESRDPTTSGHSGRVATLCCGLAEVIDRIDWGPYKDITFSYDQMKEIRYAAVLHDFGKVGVREHVLVKAEKLLPGELALLKARFDFIKRTLEARALRRKVEILLSGDRAATAALLAEVDEGLAQQIAETDGLLEFILACNRPTVLPQGGFDRLHEIAQRRYEAFEGERPYLSQDEVLALSIPKGSLTEVERKEIESHVTHTYRFLSTIPWTKSLKNIPEIAYGHHEKLDGSGYPRKVGAEVIPVQTRIMTVSDIYDALTAADRPYKAAVPIPKALEILEEEAKHGKVDPHLLQVFIEAKVYLRTQPAS